MSRRRVYCDPPSSWEPERNRPLVHIRALQGVYATLGMYLINGCAWIEGNRKESHLSYRCNSTHRSRHPRRIRRNRWIRLRSLRNIHQLGTGSRDSGIIEVKRLPYDQRRHNIHLRSCLRKLPHTLQHGNRGLTGHRSDDQLGRTNQQLLTGGWEHLHCRCVWVSQRNAEHALCLGEDAHGVCYGRRHLHGFSHPG